MIVAATCVVIWLAFSPDKLSSTAAKAVERARGEGGLAICAVTLYEVAWLAVRERIYLTDTLEFVLAQIEASFITLPITAQIAQVAAQLPDTFPRDPNDRMIAATALARGLPLITSDKAIRNSQALEVIW